MVACLRCVIRKRKILGLNLVNGKPSEHHAAQHQSVDCVFSNTTFMHFNYSCINDCIKFGFGKILNWTHPSNISMGADD